jgi:uncharacterized membrane protein
MKKNQKNYQGRDQKEFQLERMILFSDAVFAIVITLMAIEIRLPATEGKFDIEALPGMMLHLLPVFLAYCVSFFFIGAIWYQHLKMFSLLKDYDKGLVVRNLVLLFFVGLFPFSASVITRAKGAMIAYFLYMFIILFCIVAQYVLYHYIVVKRPSLRLNTDLSMHLHELRKRKIALIGFSSAAVLIAITHALISDPDLKPLSTLWMVAFPIVFKLMTKKQA